jgi:hypothetical protein
MPFCFIDRSGGNARIRVTPADVPQVPEIPDVELAIHFHHYNHIPA